MSDEKFTMFWGGPFSQFYPCTFFADVAGKVVEFNSAEQYMMYCKAMCFKDNEIAEQILKCTLAKDCKALGRKVRGFNDEQWMTAAQGIVLTGNYHKFSQNLNLMKLLLDTVGTTLVEASPVDDRWGIKLSANDPRAQHREKWLGKNLLGEILTMLRDRFIKEGKTRTTVVHCMKSEYDVYIGRGKDPKTGEIGIWGNPFSIGKDGNRNQVIAKHKAWIKTQPELLAKIHTLKGKKLACWCVPELCHGHTLAAMADCLE
jgi:ribA/ribD-fused uncharacterized protein